MATKIEFEESAAALQKRVGSLQDSLAGLDGALRTAQTGARRVTAVTQELRAAFVHAAAPLTSTLNPALAELNTLTGELGGRSGAVKAAAGLDQVQQSAAAAAKSSARAVRSLAGFDEIIRMGDPASSAAGKSSSGSKGSFGSSKKSSAQKEADTAVEQTRSAVQAVRGILDSLWEYLRSHYADTILSWGAAWRLMRDAALTVWESLGTALNELWQGCLVPLGNYLFNRFFPGIINRLSLALWPLIGGVGAAAVTGLGNAFLWLAGVVEKAVNSLVRPALEDVLVIWNGLMTGIYNAWETYGDPIFQGIILAIDNLVAILNALWNGTIQPLALHLMAQVSTVWEDSLVPLFGDFAMYMASVTNLLLSLWNQVLAPLLEWLASTFGPLVSQLCLVVSGAVTTAVGVVAGLVSTLLTALRGLLDFLSDVLCGQWQKAWDDMADTAARVWERITSTVSNAVDHLQSLFHSFVSGITNWLDGVYSTVNSLGSLPSNARKVPNTKASTYSLLPSVPEEVLQVPALARGAVIPPNREFLAVLGDQCSGTNVEAPLATIQQAVAAAMQDMQDGELAALAQVTDTLRRILEAVYGIRVGDEVIGRAAQRYQKRQSVMTGGY